MRDVRALIKEVGRGAKGARDLPQDEAEQLFGALLAGALPDLELGALLMAYRIKGESVEELIGFARALHAQIAPLPTPDAGPRPIVFASYNGARRQMNLLPLLALRLAGAGIPVLIHGVRADPQRVTSAQILARLGHSPVESPGEIAAGLARHRIVFAPIEVLAPSLARLLDTRTRLGVRSSAHTVVKLLDPFGGAGVRVVSVTHPNYLERMRAFLTATGANALLLRGTEGEPFAATRRQPAIEHFRAGEVTTILEQTYIQESPEPPEGISADLTAEWTRQVLAGTVAEPAALRNQFGCCLLASGQNRSLEMPTRATSVTQVSGR